MTTSYVLHLGLNTRRLGVRNNEQAGPDNRTHGSPMDRAVVEGRHGGLAAADSPFSVRGPKMQASPAGLVFSGRLDRTSPEGALPATGC